MFFVIGIPYNLITDWRRGEKKKVKTSLMGMGILVTVILIIIAMKNLFY
jgi:hypothetical protein